MTRFTIGLATTLCCLCVTPAASADYADPPERPPPSAEWHQDPGEDRYGTPVLGYDPPPPTSSVRVFTGPAVHISNQDPQVGLFAAFDLGRGPAGFRASGSWAHAGSAPGVSTYTGELWFDLGHPGRLRPIVAAGAGLASVRFVPDEADTPQTATAGIGVLRGGLHYLLPLGSTDARAGIDVVGCLPAVRTDEAADLSPWAIVVATLGVGF
jgi:hypothetical protein